MAQLDELIEEARGHVMTPAEKEAQRRSFAFGNMAIDDPNVTRAMIDQAAEDLDKRKK